VLFFIWPRDDQVDTGARPRDEMKTIASRHNPLVARFRAAARGERTRVLLDGAHLIAEALAAGLRVEDALVRADSTERAEIAALLEAIERAGGAVSRATSAVIDAASPVRSSSPIVALAERPASGRDRVFAAQGDALVVIACGIQDPGNVGAIVRSAEAAGASGFIAAGSTADPFGWKALRGSMGSALRVPIALEPDEQAALGDAVSRGCRIAAAVPRDGDPLFAADLSGPLAIVLGAEGRGLSPALAAAAHLRITIPMTPPVESLNTAVSAALLLYEAMRQRHAVRQPALRQGR
jgi:TrmH family RNA methyltransferase